MIVVGFLMASENFGKQEPQNYL